MFETIKKLRSFQGLDLHGKTNDEFFATVLARYLECERPYHNLEHIFKFLCNYTEVCDLDKTCGIEWTDAFVAIILHDAFCSPGQKDNEDKSAELAKSLIKEYKIPADTYTVCRLIKLTSMHGKLDPTQVSQGEALFLDCDMVILAAPRNEYNDYANNVRQEYISAGVPIKIYNTERIKFLKDVLMGKIFLSRYFRVTYEEHARENMRSEILDLLRLRELD